MVNYKQATSLIGISKQDMDTISYIKEIKQKGGNLKTMRKTFGDKKLVSLINSLYPKYDITSLQNMLSIPDSSLGYWFRKLGIEVKRRHIRNSAIPANFDGSFVLSSKKDATNMCAINVDEDLAYLIGFCIGDGAVEKFSVEVFNKDNGMKAYLENVMKRYGTVGETIRPNGLWKLRLSSVKISDLIKRNKEVREDTIDYILSEGNLANSFLAALWDAEGSVLRQGKYFHIYLYNSNKKLIDAILQHLNGIGIDTSILPMKKRENEYYLHGRKIIAKKTVYRVSIPKKNFKKWAELIGLRLKHTKKYAMVKEILKEAD